MLIHPFFAAYNVGRVYNMRVVPGRIAKDAAPLLREGYFEAPGVLWEQRIDNGYPNALCDEEFKEYRLYYTCFLRDDARAALPPAARVHGEYAFHRRDRYRPRLAGILLATSGDGENWTARTSESANSRAAGTTTS